MNAHIHAAAGQVLAGSSTIDMAGSWDKFWGAISKNLGNVTTLLSVIGMLLVVGAVLAWVFERRRSGGGGMSGPSSQKLMWALIAGAILAAPPIIKTILTILDVVVNGLISILNLGA